MPGQDPSQVVRIDQLRLIDRQHHPEVVLGGRGGEVDHHVGKRLAIGASRRRVDLETRAGHGERHGVDRPEGPAHAWPRAEARRGSAEPGAAATPSCRPADCLEAHDSEPDVLSDGGELAEQHGLADASEPGEQQVLTRPSGEQPAEADVGGLDELVAADQRGRRRARPRRVGVGDRVVSFSGHALTLAVSVKLMAHQEPLTATSASG